MNIKIYTGLLIKNFEGKILLQKPSEDTLYKDCYHMPETIINGDKETDSTVEEAFYKQTGVHAVNIKRALFDDEIIEEQGEKMHRICLLYTGEYLSGELNGDYFAWISPQEINKIKLSLPMQKMIAVLGKWKNKFIFPSGLFIPNSTHEN